MNINPQFYFRAKPSDWKTNPANNHYVYGFYHTVTDNYTPKNVHTITTFTENEKEEIILQEAIDIDIDTICKCTGCYDSKHNLLWEKDTVADLIDKTLFGTIVFKNSIPCIEFNKRPTFACVIMETTDTDTTTTILTPSLYKRIIKCVIAKCDEKPNKSLKNTIIELLKQDYDDAKLSEKLSMLVNHENHDTASLFKDMPCNINDTVYIASNNAMPEVIASGLAVGLYIGRVINFVIDRNNIRYIEIETKHGNQLLSEEEFKQYIVKTPFNPHF